jgi:hypothetical protein
MDENNTNMSSYCGEDAHNVWFFPICIEFWRNPMNNLFSGYKCDGENYSLIDNLSI